MPASCCRVHLPPALGCPLWARTCSARPAWCYLFPVHQEELHQGRQPPPPGTDQADAPRWVQVSTLKPDKFVPKVIKKTNEYLYVEYEASV